MLDENVPVAVAVTLRGGGHEVILSVEAVAPGAPDPIVATAAQEAECILLSHDRDMRRLERAFSEGVQGRYPRLSRIVLTCPEPRSAARISEFLTVISAEFERVSVLGDPRLFMEIGERRLRIMR